MRNSARETAPPSKAATVEAEKMRNNRTGSTENREKSAVKPRSKGRALDNVRAACVAGCKYSLSALSADAINASLARSG